MPGNNQWVDWGKIAVQHAQKPQQKLKGKAMPKIENAKLIGIKNIDIEVGNKYVDWVEKGFQPLIQKAKPQQPVEQLMFFGGFNPPPAEPVQPAVEPFDEVKSDLWKTYHELEALIKELEDSGEEVPILMRRAYLRLRQFENDNIEYNRGYDDGWKHGWEEAKNGG